MEKEKGDDAVVNKLKDLGQNLLNEIESGTSPTLEFLARGLDNVIYDKEKKILILGDRKEHRVFLSAAQAKKFMQTIAVAAKCKKFKEENLHTSIRGLFYQLKFTLGEDIEEDLFEEQAESLHPNEPMLVRIGNKLSIASGEKIFNEAMGLGKIIPGNPSIKITEVRATVPSFDKSLKIKEHSIKSFIKNIHPRKMLVIKTKSGRSVTVTPFHSLFTVDEHGNIISIKASKLKVGDRIAVARRIDISENRDPIDLYEVFKSAPKEVIEKLYVHLNRRSISKILKSCDISEIKYITLYEWKKFNRIPLLFLYKNKVPNSLLPSNSRLSIVGGRHEYPLKISKSKDLGIVLGYLLSEGSNTINNERDGARTVSFSNKSKLIMREFIDSFSKVFGKPTTKILISKKIINGKAFYTKRINIGYDLLSYILEYAFDYPAGIKSEAKRVPSILLDAPKECIEGFLYSYVKGDGTHQSTRYTKVIRIYSSSKEMINSIAFLLLRFGIFPRICTPKLRTGRKQEYILYVSSKEYVKKLNEITGSFQSPKFNDKSTTEDYLPVKKLILAAKKLCKIPDREYKRINFYTKTKNISRPKVRRLINILEKYSNSNPHLDKLKTLVDSDIYWDEIKEINFDEAPYTLDLSVVDGQEPIENFLGGFGWICLHNSNEIVEDLEVLLGAKREDLNLSTDRKGVVAGPLIIKDKFAGTTTTIDCTKMGRSGWMIPSDVDNGMEFVKCDADYVLCIEKDALWQRLNEDQFWKKENCLIVTPKGQASRGCRRLIRKLADMKLPIYCYMDCDAWGWYIYWTIKTGSMNLAYLGSEISTPEAKFLGVTMKDIERYPFLKKLTIRAKDVDIKRAEEMLSYPWISMHKEWVEELKTVLETKKKLEQDALQGPRLTFVGDYIREKINNKEFLP